MRRGSGAKRFMMSGGSALHGCNGSVWRGVLRTVSRARARTEAASPRDKGRGRPGPARSVRRGAGWGFRARRSGVGEVQPRPGECWARSASRIYPRMSLDLPNNPVRGPFERFGGLLGGVTPTLGGVAPIYGGNSPQHGCNSPQPGAHAPPPAEHRRAPGNARPTNHPAPRSWPASGASHPSHARTGVPQGGGGGSAGANAHVGDGVGTGARPPDGPRRSDGRRPASPAACGAPHPRPSTIVAEEQNHPPVPLTSASCGRLRAAFFLRIRQT